MKNTILQNPYASGIFSMSYESAFSNKIKKRNGRWHFLLKCTATFSLIFVFATAQAQTTWYVKPAASGSGNGSSWTNASASLQSIITGAASGDQVWVAGGKYSISATLTMKVGVSVYGGFAGVITETSLSQRDTTNNIVAQRDTIKITAANKTVVSFPGTSGTPFTSATVFSGFTITGASGSMTPLNGMGIDLSYASPTLSHLIVTGNSGSNAAAGAGGAVHLNNSSSPSMSYCRIIANNNTTGASTGGGGIGIEGSSLPVISNSNISYDSASGSGSLGGGIYNGNPNTAGTLVLSYDTINNNYAASSSNYGAGVYSKITSLTLTNCVISNNYTKGFGGGVAFGGSTATGATLIMTNCQLSGNTSINAGNAGAGLFVNCTTGSSVSIDSCSFTGNSATSGAGGGINFGVAATTTSIKHTTFLGNKASSNGGGIFFNFNSVASSTATLFDLVFYNDSALNGT